MRNVCIAVLLSGLCSGLAVADELVMKNGSRIVGKLVKAGGGDIEFDTPWGGTLKVKEANVESISTDQPHSVIFPAESQIPSQTVPPSGHASIWSTWTPRGLTSSR